MGGNHSHQFDQKLFQSQWERNQGSSFDGRTAWKNKINPSRQIEEHAIFADKEEDIEIQRELFTLRRDSNELVAATHFKETVKGGLCSSSAQGRLFLERIPLKLQALQHIPFPDILHLHFNALTGYKRLNNVVGPFRPQNEQIGFNSAGEAKVWLSSDFSASSPSSRQISEAAMVRNLLQIIEDCTDNNSTPKDNPSILNYIYQNKTDVSFDQALSAIKEYANQYNGGLIPKNLECIQKVGVQKISKSLVGEREQSFAPNIVPIQRSTYGNVVQPQQHTSNVYGTLNNSNGPLNNSYGSYEQRYHPASNTAHFNSTQVVNGNVPTFHHPVQVVQSPQNFQPLQNVQPVHNVPITQSTHTFGSSGVRTQNLHFNPVNVQVQNPVEQRFLQSQVQTVRPVQPVQPVFVRPAEDIRVVQQVIRSPQHPVEFIPQQPFNSGIVTSLVEHGSRINNLPGQVFYQNTPVPQIVQNQFVAHNPTIQSPLLLQNRKQSEIQILNRLQLQSQPNSLTQPEHVVRTSQQTPIRETFGDQYNQKARNFIDSNTMSIGIDRGNNQEHQSYTTSPQRQQTGHHFVEQTSAKYKDVNLEDGKSSEALLAALRGFSSSRKEIEPYNNDYQYTSNTYTTRTENTYEPTKDSYSYQPVTQDTSDIYKTFNKYSKGSGLDQNLDMKYSMTKNLYEQPTTNTNYQFESLKIQQNAGNLIESQYEYSQDIVNYEHEGQYHVDFDPEILADIQKLKG